MSRNDDQRAAERLLEIIGEASNTLTDDFNPDNPQRNRSPASRRVRIPAGECRSNGFGRPPSFAALPGGRG